MSEYAIELQDEMDVADFPAERMIAAITHVLAEHGVEAGTALSVVLSTNEAVRQLNVEFRHVDATTDILSFPADPLPAEIQEEFGEPPYLGDLIIAYPYTVHQAEEAGHRLDDELVLLVVHGTLHLLGYDHDNAEHQDAMWQEQSTTLVAMDVAIEVPRFSFGDNEDTGNSGDSLDSSSAVGAS